MTADGLCHWTGCHCSGDALLEGRLLCKDHFHKSANKKLSQYHSNLREANDRASERAALIRFVSEMISQTTLLVSSTKLLSETQRELFLGLSRSSLQFYKRVQRDRLPLVPKLKLIKQHVVACRSSFELIGKGH